MNLKLLKIFGIVLLIFTLNSCKGGDARKNPPQPELRVKKNLEEGKGFRLNDALNKTIKGGGGTFDFASSNELWRASLDIIDFMPLLSANYSGGLLLLIGIQKIKMNLLKLQSDF